MSDALEVAVKSASYNIVLQILMRILSSLCNAVVLRFITKDALGVVNVRFMLLYSTCHFFSREAFRRSGLSKCNVYDFLQKCNLLWLCLPTCLMCSSVLGYVWLYWLENPSPDLVPNYSLGVLIVLISVFIETIAEPVYVFSRIYHFVKLKVLIEGLSLTLKSVSMVIFLWLWPGNAVYAFCISQILSSVCYTSAFYGYFWWYFRNPANVMTKLPIHSLKGLLPRLPYFFVDKEDLRLTWSFFKQSLLKQLLTEGERYIMTFFSVMSFAEQGLYDVVSNLGSLSARFIFLPIDDSGYLLFTQLLPRDKRLISLLKRELNQLIQQPTLAPDGWDAKYKSNNGENLSQCLHILEKLLKLLLLLGLMILTFGFSYSKLLLLLYGGSDLSSSIAVTLLRWHCAYVLLLAVNGITECFKFAVMNQQQLDAYNKKMLFLSIGFLFAAFVFAKTFGAVGFIMANCFNMGLRIIHSIRFIDEYFSIHYFYLIRKLIPHPLVLTMLASSLCVTSISEVYFCCDQGFKLWMWHLGIGMCCFFAFIISVFFKEKAALKFIYDQRSDRTSSFKKKS